MFRLKWANQNRPWAMSPTNFRQKPAGIGGNPQKMCSEPHHSDEWSSSSFFFSAFRCFASSTAS
jgi:hypothetical protein